MKEEEIGVLFIERVMQLMKDNGIGIVFIIIIVPKWVFGEFHEKYRRFELKF